MYLEGESGQHGRVKDISCVCFKHLSEHPAPTESDTSPFILLNLALCGLGPPCTESLVAASNPIRMPNRTNLLITHAVCAFAFFLSYCQPRRLSVSCPVWYSSSQTSRTPGICCRKLSLHSPRMTPSHALPVPSTLRIHLSSVVILLRLAHLSVLLESEIVES